MKQRDYFAALQYKIQKGHRGFPLATVVYYGPNNERASKAAVGIVLKPKSNPCMIERWFNEESDLRKSECATREIVEFLEKHQIKTVVSYDGIFGCPHESSYDFPEGEICPLCDYWKTHRRTGRPAYRAPRDY
jgi:hypothetical protein